MVVIITDVREKWSRTFLWSLLLLFTILYDTFFLPSIEHKRNFRKQILTNFVA